MTNILLVFVAAHNILYLLVGVPFYGAQNLKLKPLFSIEDEYIALSASLTQPMPLKRSVELVWKDVVLKINKSITIKSTVWKDNQECAIVTNMDPPRMTPRTEHFANKYHQFSTQLEQNGMVIKYISSAL